MKNLVLFSWICLTLVGCGDQSTNQKSPSIPVSTRFIQVETISVKYASDPLVVKDTKTGRLYFFGYHGGILEVNEKPIEIEK